MMDVLDRLLEHDLWFARRILERAASLRPAALDRRVWERWDRMPFDADEPTVRSMLARMVWTYENWTASVAGREAPRSGGSSIDALRLRLERSGPEFVALVRDRTDRTKTRKPHVHPEERATTCTCADRSQWSDCGALSRCPE